MEICKFIIFSEPVQSKGGKKIFGHLLSSDISYKEVNADTVFKSYLDSVLLKKWRGAEGNEWREKNKNSFYEDICFDGEMCDDGDLVYIGIYKENGIDYDFTSFYPPRFSIDMDLSLYKAAIIELTFIDDISYWFDGDLLVDESVYHHYCKDAEWRDSTRSFDLPF